MKKFLAAMLAVLLLLSAVSLTSCGNTNKDTDDDAPASAKELYEKAETAMGALKSYTLLSKTKIDMDMMGTNTTVQNDATTYADLENKRISSVNVSKSSGVSVESSLYLDSEVYMMEAYGMKYMAKIGDSMNTLMEEYGAALNIDFENFTEATMEKEEGGYLLKIKGLKNIDGLGDLLGDNLEGISLSVLSSALETMEMTLHTDKSYYFTSIELSMTITADMNDLISGDLDFDFDSSDLDFGSDDLDLDLDFGSDDLGFDFGSGDLEFGEMTVAMTISMEFSDFDASAEKIVKPATEDYEEVDLDEILGMSDLLA